VLRVGALGSCKARHAGVSQLLYSDLIRSEERSCFFPDGFVERKGVGEESIRSAVCIVLVDNVKGFEHYQCRK
jgi:hypothetical protein